MSDKNIPEITNATLVDDTVSRKNAFLEIVTLYKRKLQQGAAFGATSGIKLYEFVKPHVSWKQRVLNFLKGD